MNSAPMTRRLPAVLLPAAASFEDDEGNSLSALEFFARLVAGTFIEIRDDDRNGIFDQAEMEN